MAANARSVVINFLGNATGLTGAANQGSNAVGGFAAKTQKFAKIGMAAVGALGAAWVGSVKAGLDGLKEGEEAENEFNTAISKAPPIIQRSKDAIMAHAEAIQLKTKFTYEDALATGSFIAAQDGLQKAVKAGVASVQDLTDVSLNLATVQKTDGPTAAAKLAKWLAKPEAATAGLRKAGILLTAAEEAKVKAWTKAGKTGLAQALILDKVKAKTDGASMAAGETMTGRIERAQNAFGEFQEGLAAGVLPALTNLLGIGTKVTSWLAENPGKVQVLVIAFGALAAVIGTISVVTKVMAAGQAIAAAVTTLAWSPVLGPFILITAAVVALGLAFVALWKKSDTFRAIVTDAFNAVRHAASAAFSWVRDNWPLLIAIITGPVGIAVAAVVKNFDRIKAAAVKVKSGVVTAFSTVADAISAPFRAAAEAVQSVWNSTVGGKGFSFGGWDPPGPGSIPGISLTIPRLATGGEVTRRGWAMVGENGAELVNLGRGAQVVPLDRAGGGATEVHIHATGPTLQDIVRVEIREANRATRSAVLAGRRA